MTDGTPPTSRRDELAAVTALGEPSRRALYDHVVEAGDWVSRDQAADAVGLERGTAAHHLDRLAVEGLLDIDYRRLSGRQGPGAGRPAKVYRRARRDFEVSLPPRDYELAGRLLAEAADRSRTTGVEIVAALDEAASEEGQRLATRVRASLADVGSGPPADEARRAAIGVLEHEGYEPSTDPDGTVVLRNCPFHALAAAHTDLICGMNLCLLSGAIDALGGAGLSASLEPDADHCCVRLHPTA